MQTRFTTKLIIGIVLIEALMFALIIWNSVRLSNQGYSDLFGSAMKEETLLLANALSPGLAANDRALVIDTLSLLAKSKGMVYAVVYDRNSRIFATIGNISKGTVIKIPEDDTIDLANESIDAIYTLEHEISVAEQKLGLLEAGFSVKTAKRSITHTRRQSLFLALLGLAVTVAITMLAGFYLSRRLGALEEGASRLSRGMLNYRIPVSHQDEISKVADSFNNMAENLQETRAALQIEHQTLLNEQGRLNTLLDSIDAVVFEGDPVSFEFNYVSQEAINILGYEIDEWLKPDFFWSHVHCNDITDIRKELELRASPGQSLTLDFRMFHKEGYHIWVRNIISFETDIDGNVVARGLIIDINEQKKGEEQILYLAQHDVLTGLYNRRRFHEELQKNINMAQRLGYEFGLLFIDLDQFKFINDTLGHHTGDKYLVSVARNLRETLRETDIIGRLGGDEFAVIVPKGGPADLGNVSKKILAALGSSSDGDNDALKTHISASIGIAIYPQHGTGADELLAKADAAMYTAKAGGKNIYHIFDDTDNQLVQMQEKLHWEERIRSALATDGFLLHYQPIINIQSGVLSHHEALLRMLDSETGEIIAPASFMEIAERFGLIYDIDLWVLEEAIRILASEGRNNLPTTLAVNISGRSLGKMDLVGKISGFLDHYEVKAEKLIIEVTETAAVENIVQANNFIDTLHRLGCRVALDDFGAGFSSLRYLKHLSIDSIKIDGSFIRDISEDSSNRMLVKAICDIAQGLNVSTVAEYVDNDNTLEILKQLGVNYGQGFFLGKPQPSLPVELVN